MDDKGVKQILRHMLSKFIRRQPGRTDSDWANMWPDLECLHEKAFTSVDLEFMQMEFCRGLLKAGKFSLARNYLKVSGSVALPIDKAENLVIQAAREYFFSASSLTCSEIWKAKECLNIFPSSRNVKVEADIIDALTVKLPNLGVSLLPMQFRQIKDPMEIIHLAIRSEGGVYMNVEELIEIAKLLGMRSQDDISVVQEAIAREAAVAGDLQLAFDLCLDLVKRGHGPVWDLCAALARGPTLENMDVSSRVHLLGFSLGHCDEESIGELLLSWKELDTEALCKKLGISNTPPKFSAFPPQDTQDCDDQETYFNSVKKDLSDVAKSLSSGDDCDWETLLRENAKLLDFVTSRLPWLLELSQKSEDGKLSQKLEDGKSISGLASGKIYSSKRLQALVTVLSWLGRNGLAPRDHLIASFAKLILEPPVSIEDDILGGSILLNLVDAFHGVELIEEQVKCREDYNEISSIMNVGLIYSLLQNSKAACESPAKRKELLIDKFQEKHKSLSSDEREKLDKAQSSFWSEWKFKLEEQKRLANQTREIEQIFPGVDSSRFLSGDVNYIEGVVFSQIESVKLEKKSILKEVLNLACNYGLSQIQVLLKFLCSVLPFDVWAIGDVELEITEFRGKLLDFAEKVIKTISVDIYPAIDGRKKERLAYLYRLLSDHFLQVEETKDLLPIISSDGSYITPRQLASFFKIIEKECLRVSFIEDLNFKNIAGLQGLNLECFTGEVFAHVCENTVEALAEMVEALVGIFGDLVPEGLVSWQYVYKHHVTNLLTALETSAKMKDNFQSPDYFCCFIIEIEDTYQKCRKYVKVTEFPDVLDVMKQFFSVTCSFSDFAFENTPSDLAWKNCLVVLLNFWLRLSEDLQEFMSQNNSEGNLSPGCFRVFLGLVEGGKVSLSEGWGTVFEYARNVLTCGASVDIVNFCRSMICSGCQFGAIADVFSEAISHLPLVKDSASVITDLPHLYLCVLETILGELASGSLDHSNLHNLLSSMSKTEGDIENLTKVREAVWERLAKFSEDFTLPSKVRVYALELMQFIADRNSNLFSNNLQANVLPWEGWDNSGNMSSHSGITANSEAPGVVDASMRVTNTLVALRSSQLVSVISPNSEISPDDLLSIESAVSCFLKLSGLAISEPHIDALLSILGEWESLFVAEIGKSDLLEPLNAVNDWGSDDWNEGWESFQEEPSDGSETNIATTLSVHPLHVCWMEIFKKLVSSSQLTNILRLIDQSFAKKRGVLLDEDEAQDLRLSLGEKDCFTALKVLMLFPFERLQLDCLDAVEAKLQGGMPDAIAGDHELVILVLFSGLLSKIVTRPSYGSTFSCLCYIVGNLSRSCQEARLLQLRTNGKNQSGEDENEISFIFWRIVFPYFISELVKVNQQFLAGLMVTKVMHTNASLGLINVADASLRRYLETQLQGLRDKEISVEWMKCCEILANTVDCLRSRLESLIQSVLVLLSKTDVR